MAGVDGVIVPGGFGTRGTEGKIACIKYARQNQPYLMNDGLINHGIKKWGYVLKKKKKVDLNTYLSNLSVEDQLKFLNNEDNTSIEDGTVKIYVKNDPIYFSQVNAPTRHA